MVDRKRAYIRSAPEQTRTKGKRWQSGTWRVESGGSIYAIHIRYGEISWGAVAGFSPAHKMPESFRAFCKMVSLTAAKTSRTLVVSVA